MASQSGKDGAKMGGPREKLGVLSGKKRMRMKGGRGKEYDDAEGACRHAPK